MAEPEDRSDASLERWEKSGWVFSIQRFSLHDGPGIRNIVFLKGCPLACVWCSNPESRLKSPQVLLKEELCLGFDVCGLCTDSCPEGALKANGKGKARIDWPLCNHCGACAVACPVTALEMAGRKMMVREVVDDVEKDGGFHFRSGGGITVSGGEPIMQADFVSCLLSSCKERLIDTAVETAGYGSWKNLSKTVRNADLVFYDIKSLDPTKHKLFVGFSNDLILKNLIHLATHFPDKPVIVRTPVISGFNDTDDDILEILEFLKQVKTVKDYQLLPYHKFGITKYQYIGKQYPNPDLQVPDSSRMNQLKALVEKNSLLRSAVQ
ncbi:MAG TPA: glycyl-radical enzyme activating protein [Gammaproteobacteria bacterium]|jgi:pyruvate formate lyase activating enzyme|nr:pyruvate formate lyase-activating protein [Acidiferrobacteraceae bacterium]MDP6919130.1 glycyl-radical enzyme activating protein [Arenicellales bacterium]HCX87391.1 glycyl-radical enzyme activating protein [Gammaproteobacteria bacterium]|tara:strand:+ start:10778 stop:11746 length:969 start_codon:yes stop_codon:yes gene_type:complete